MSIKAAVYMCSFCKDMTVHAEIRPGTLACDLCGNAMAAPDEAAHNRAELLASLAAMDALPAVVAALERLDTADMAEVCLFIVDCMQRAKNGDL